VGFLQIVPGVFPSGVVTDRLPGKGNASLILSCHREVPCFFAQSGENRPLWHLCVAKWLQFERGHRKLSLQRSK